MQRYKQFLAMLLAMVLVFTAVPFTAKAETASGSNGETVLYQEDFSGDAEGWSVSGNNEWSVADGILYEEDFEQSAMPTGWSGDDKWSIADGKLTANWTADANNTQIAATTVYRPESEEKWSGYVASSDITLYKQENNAWSSIALCTYVMSTNSGKRFEIRVGISNETTYTVGIYRKADTSGWAVSQTKYQVDSPIEGYADGKVTFNLKADMSDGMINVYINDQKALENGYSLENETYLTSGVIGFFAMRSTSGYAGPVKFEMDNVKVYLPSEDSGEEEKNPAYMDVNAENALTLYGVEYNETSKSFARMDPTVAASIAGSTSYGKTSVYTHACESAGGRIRFSTDSPYVGIKAVLQHYDTTYATGMGNGKFGFDVYVDTENGSTYAGTIAPASTPNATGEISYEGFVDLGEAAERNITIYFPLTIEVKGVQVGVETGSKVEEHKIPYEEGAPVVFYGSSITQGGVATKPGNAYTAIVGRELNRDILNLGMWGSAHGQTAFANYIAGLEMSAFVFDYDHNQSNTVALENTHYPFYEIVRKAHPDIPIIFITRPNNNGNHGTNMKPIIKASYDKAVAAGDKNVYFIDGKTDFFHYDSAYLGDSVHPNDNGQAVMGAKVAEVLKAAYEAVVESEIDFYSAENWDPNATMTWEVGEDYLLAGIDGTHQANGGAAFVPEEALEWKDYRFSADFTMEKSEGGSYAQPALRVYAQGTNYNVQMANTYEARMEATSATTYSIQLYKMYPDATGARVAQKITGGSAASTVENGYGGDSITYNVGMQVLDGVITVYINGELGLTYDTAKENTAWNGAYEKGTIGIWFLRPSTDMTAGYTVKLTNLKVEEGELPPEPPKPEDDVVSGDRVLKNDENFLVVNYDNFSSYTDGSVGTWNWENNDAKNGEWRINNGLLVNGTDDSGTNTIALSGNTTHSFGGVVVDVMLSSKLTNNLYAGPVAAYNGAKNYYHLRLGDMADGRNLVQLFRMDSGSAKSLASATLDFEIKRDTWYQLELSMIDGVLHGYVDGKLYVTYDTANDPVVYTAGCAGVRSSQGAAIFDNFAIKVPREEASIDENFDTVTSLDGTNWTDENTDGNTGQWTITDGALAQTDEAANKTYIMLYDDGKNMSFGGASMDVKITSANTGNIYAGPVVAYNGAKNYYHLRIADRADGIDLLQLYKMTSGSAALMLSVTLPFTFERNTWYNVEMYQYNGTVYGYIDDILYLQHTPKEGITYESGQVGIRVSQGSAVVDNFIAYGAAAGQAGVDVVNDTVVENPLTYTDDFEDETVGESPDYWLENNTTEIWQVAELKGNKVYGMTSLGKVSSSWLHVFETNMDVTADLYVASEGTAASAEVGLITRLSGKNADVRVVYDFEQGKWYVQDCKGPDFLKEMQVIYAAESSEFALDTWHTVRVRVVDCKLQLWCDGSLVLETDKITHISTGRAALYTDNAVLYADNVKVELLSGQGRVEKAALEHYVISDDYYSEGGSLFWYSDDIALFNGLNGRLYISEDQGDSFRLANAQEQEKYAFFIQNPRRQYIELHNGYILKLGYGTSGTAHLSKDRGETYELVGMMWDPDDLPKWGYYGGMNDMVKEVNLGDIDGDGEDNYRVFYCADARTYGNPEGVGSSITYHWEEIYYTDDFGYTWTKCEMDTRWISAQDHICEARIVACDDGTLRMYSTWNHTLSMRYFISYDHGETWEGEYALPELRCSRSSFNYAIDEETGDIYIVFVYGNPTSATELLRNRMVLIRSTDGKIWEFLMDIWRFEDVPTDRLTNINQTVDPAITITDDFVFVTAGWSEAIDPDAPHNAGRQTIVKLEKDALTPYEEWPEDWALADDIVHTDITAPSKLLYKTGETLDLTGGYLTVHYYDGSSKEVPLTDAGVVIREIDPSNNYTSDFAAPDMAKAGLKMLRVDYEGFAASYTVLVVDDHAEAGSAGDVNAYPVDLILDQEELVEGAKIEVANEISEYTVSGLVMSKGGAAAVTVGGTAAEVTLSETTFDGPVYVFEQNISLAEGENKIEVIATDATGSEEKITFTIVRAKSEGGSGEGGSGSGSESGSGSGSDSGSDSSSDNAGSTESAAPAAGSDTPARTGDANNAWIWMFAAVVSAMALFNLIYFRRTKEGEDK